MNAEGPPAFAPGSHPIVAHGGGAFAFAGMLHHGSILATPAGVRPLVATGVETLNEQTLGPLFTEIDEAPRSIEFLVVGTGAQLVILPKPLSAALRRAGLRFEDDGHRSGASRVYNVMRVRGPPSRRRPDRGAVTERGSLGDGMLTEAHKYCASIARQHARDQWLGALYARPADRDALLALASFDHEIRQARLRARDPNLAAIRLAWWRGVVRSERDEEAAGSPVALALRSAIEAFELNRDWVEAMIDARLQEMAPQDDFGLAAFEAYSQESEGVRLRLASQIASGGPDLDSVSAHAPAGLAVALARMLVELPSRAERLR